MKPHILLYTDDPAGGCVADSNHLLLLALAGRGYRVTCVQSAATDDRVEAWRSAGVNRVWLGYDTRTDFLRSVVDPQEPGRLFDDLRPDLIVFSGTSAVANVAARHAAIQRNLAFVIVVGQASGALSDAQSRALGVAKAQYRQARAVLAFRQEELDALRRLVALPAGLGELVAADAAADAVCRHAPEPELAPTRALPEIPCREHSAGDVAVLIQTTNRPAMLRTALASVRAQTAFARIREVVVSENTPIAAGTAALCAEFAADLPIRFLHRQPQLLAMQHDRAMLSEPRSARYSAILHDDDWWAPEHLASSLHALEAHEAVACYSSFFDVTGESSPLRSDTNGMTWFGGGFLPLIESWKLDSEAVLMSCLPGTPGRYSTLVARTEALRASTVVYDLNNPYDNDRMLNVALAERGPVAFCPRPSAFIRMHPEQGSRRFQSREIVQRMYDTTMWLLDQASRLGVDVASALQRRVNACPEPHLPLVLNLLSVPWVRAALKSRPGVPQPLLAAWRQIELNQANLPAAARTAA